MNECHKHCNAAATIDANYCTDLHFEEAKGFPVYEQDNHNGSQGHIGAKNAQRGNANKVPEERLLANLQPSTEDDWRQKEPADHQV